INDKINDKINSLDSDILSLIRKNKYITISEISKLTGKSKPTVYRHIESLNMHNLLVRVGSRKNGYWEIIE
ncbi:MAG: winged helix-turn-helix transcriptional regulator, partial [Erysipelotrichaceae bacterium]|nr:winged helix-turn-helix transcriptional regulator [Erysipelotrichaceae bacterium]